MGSFFIYLRLRWNRDLIAKKETQMTRYDNRNVDEIRPVRLTNSYLIHPAGSVLMEMGNTKIGIITSGISYEYCREVFGDNVSYLKIGFSYPLPDEMIKEFASKVEKLYVVEENDPYLENSVKALGISCIGKEVIPICEEVLCPGCPHRGIFYAVSKYKDVIASGDIGCYTLGMNAPLSVTDTVICMGASISAGVGMERASIVANREDKKVFAFIGDSTFFHSGVTGLIESVYNNTPIVTVILDNRITGMTGHQENPGTGRTLQNREAPMVDIEALVLACGIKKENIKVVDPYKIEETSKAVKEAHDSTEPFVIITKQPCALIKDVLKKRANLKCKVDVEKCKKCKMCLKTGCPALKFQNGVVEIDESMCNGCEICKQVCPFDAIEKVGE